MKESNLTAAQIAGGEDIPKAEVVVKWTYELGKSLVPPEVVSVLPTQMYKLHQHYMRAMADCIFMQGAKIKDGDFLRGGHYMDKLGRNLPTIPSGGPRHLYGRLVGSISILLSLRIVLHDLNILIP